MTIKKPVLFAMAISAAGIVGSDIQAAIPQDGKRNPKSPRLERKVPKIPTIRDRKCWYQPKIPSTSGTVRPPPTYKLVCE
jgi:hypothetical protein